MTVDYFIIAMMAGFVLLLLLTLIRVFKGPTVYDRLNGIGIIATDAVILLVLFGALSKREDMYLDIAITYSILGFIGSIVIAKFLFEEVKRRG